MSFQIGNAGPCHFSLMAAMQYTRHDVRKMNHQIFAYKQIQTRGNEIESLAFNLLGHRTVTYEPEAIENTFADDTSNSNTSFYCSLKMLSTCCFTNQSRESIDNHYRSAISPAEICSIRAVQIYIQKVQAFLAICDVFLIIISCDFLCHHRSHTCTSECFLKFFMIRSTIAYLTSLTLTPNYVNIYSSAIAFPIMLTSIINKGEKFGEIKTMCYSSHRQTHFQSVKD